MNRNCVKGKKLTSSRGMCFLLGAAKLKYLLLFLIIFIGCLNGRIIYTWGSDDDDSRKNPQFLIDIPGVGWTGGARVNDWGDILNPDKVTIYIRHQGPGIDKWLTPKEPNAIIVTLPNQWDEKTASKLLLRHINSAYSQGKDVHYIVDKNITLTSHLTNIKPQEDMWAANVTDYISSNRPSNYRGILAEHSRGTVTNAYIKDFSHFERVIISSPRGDEALSWIHRTPNLPQIDIITGVSDAPNWRWTVRYNTLLKENPNIRIVQLQNIADPATTHSRLENLGTNGNWKILTGNGSQDFKGTLGDYLLNKQFTQNPDYKNINRPPPDISIQKDENWKKTVRGPFPPPPGGPGGGAANVGGVCNNPEPVSNGKGGSETKKKVLESRPSGDSLTWTSDSAGE